MTLAPTAFSSVLSSLPDNFLVPLDGEPRTPMPGDRAFTRYRGSKFIGTLTTNFGTVAKLVYTHVIFEGKTYTAELYGNYHGGPHLYVGSDGPIVWDDSENMWNAHADHD